MSEPRFATTEQISQVTGFGQKIDEHRELFGGLVTTLAGYIEAYELTFFADNPAGIETRYVTANGEDNEEWRGNLLSASPGRKKVNLWLITLTGMQGKPFSEDEMVGSFVKPISLGVDYYYDYDFGTDSVKDDDGNLIINNSEDFFNMKVQGLDLILEEMRNCLPNGSEILSWFTKTGIKRFKYASTHFAKTDLATRSDG